MGEEDDYIIDYGFVCLMLVPVLAEGESMDDIDLGDEDREWKLHIHPKGFTRDEDDLVDVDFHPRLSDFDSAICYLLLGNGEVLGWCRTWRLAWSSLIPLQASEGICSVLILGLAELPDYIEDGVEEFIEIADDEGEAEASPHLVSEEQP